MNHPRARRLDLSRQTLHHLDDRQLGHVRGGRSDGMATCSTQDRQCESVVGCRTIHTDCRR